MLLDMGLRVVAPDMMGYGGTVSCRVVPLVQMYITCVCRPVKSSHGDIKTCGLHSRCGTPQRSLPLSCGDEQYPSISMVGMDKTKYEV